MINNDLGIFNNMKTKLRTERGFNYLQNLAKQIKIVKKKNKNKMDFDEMEKAINLDAKKDESDRNYYFINNVTNNSIYSNLSNDNNNNNNNKNKTNSSSKEKINDLERNMSSFYSNSNFDDVNSQKSNKSEGKINSKIFRESKYIFRYIQIYLEQTI